MVSTSRVAWLYDLNIETKFKKSSFYILKVWYYWRPHETSRDVTFNSCVLKSLMSAVRIKMPLKSTIHAQLFFCPCISASLFCAFDNTDELWILCLISWWRSKSVDGGQSQLMGLKSADGGSKSADGGQSQLLEVKVSWWKSESAHGGQSQLMEDSVSLWTTKSADRSQSQLIKLKFSFIREVAIKL